jgi:hypothetical protein
LQITKNIMKLLLILLVSLVSPTFIFGQSIENQDQTLNKKFKKISDWTDGQYGEASFDSLQQFNNDFELALLRATSSNQHSLNSEFKDLKKLGLFISTSPDGLFRIYTWDDQTGGTMRRFRNVFQYKSDEKIISKVLIWKENANEFTYNDFLFKSINQVTSGNKTYYVTYSIFIGSTAAFYHMIKIFSIDAGQLNDNAALIKTTSGIVNELGYDIDFSSEVNRNSKNREYSYVEYDKEKQTISIPLLLEDGKLTQKKIRYHFTGKYFEKI